MESEDGSLLPRRVRTSDDDEQLPLVAAHTNVLNRSVQYLRFALVYRVDRSLEQRRYELFLIWKPVVETRR